MKALLYIKLLLCCFILFNSTKGYNQELKLWEYAIPGEIKSKDYKEVLQIENGTVLRAKQVTNPTLTIFKPQLPNGTAILIIPGGGYHHVTINKEGAKVAEWLNTLGITAFVLKYRLPSDVIMKDKSIGPLQDAQKAIRYIKHNSEAFQLKTDKIGVLGFSAGGHLAAMVSTQFNKKVYKETDSISAKPDFSILIYPVISMKDSLTHQGSKRNLLGETPSKEKVEIFSNETQVTALTPKTFLVHATDDKSVSVENSIRYYLALKKHNVSAEMHIYENGGHGFGLGIKNTSQFWVNDCTHWLKFNGLID
ncbi:alpha/beta hydrolase [uncultured Algibacter sp.]|uniref:alpha/beta hydrolase n=1 Tax=uncultured Algibacter sp. TaxID=298659 RepID=UPI00262CB919|nr:alpha/beta hydrolase [uncultured Algibacter sp.]